jgi:putative transposase
MIILIKNKAYKFRLFPNKEQEIYFSKCFGCVRFIYNQLLANRKEIYDQYKDNKEELKLHKPKTYSQLKKEYEWLYEIDNLALANAQMNLQTSYNNFFRDIKVGFPKFKSKHKDRNSYTTNNQNGSIRIENKHIKLPKIGFVKVKQHRQITDSQKIKSCTISKSPSGKYYVSILVEYEEVVPEITINPDNVIGLDMDMKNLFTDSQGNRAEYPRYYRQMQNKLAREQRRLSKCVRGSNNYRRQKLIVAKLHEKVANQRKDFLHKLSNQIANDYDGVCIENLNMKAMSQCLHLGKSVSDNGWGMFTAFLVYKLADKGKSIVKIDKWYPSSKMCNVCGTLNDNLTLSDREWTCDGCNTHHDRDWNAAINIKNEGIRLLIQNAT